MDVIDGLKFYLLVVEKDWFNMIDVFDMSVLYFEKLLFYVVLLGVEKFWFMYFEIWFFIVLVGLCEYYLNWYRG